MEGRSEFHPDALRLRKYNYRREAVQTDFNLMLISFGLDRYILFCFYFIFIYF